MLKAGSETCAPSGGAMTRSFRVILSSSGAVTSLVVPLEIEPRAGDTIRLPDGRTAVVSHVISSPRDGLAGIVHAESA
jgi:hypothetical protein